MGKTIDEYLLMNLHKTSNITDNDTVNMLAYLASSTRNILKPREKEACANAIRTIHKYQKIEQILSDWINDDSVGMSDYWMGRIKEVIEDGQE